jgi:NTP pyrophosphatase (non-canonical NTP hydrolase)
MTPKEYQDFCSTTVIYSPHNALPYLSSGLASEVGEVLDHIAKYYRDNKPINTTAITKELGDCFWILTNMCSYFNLEVEDVISANVSKLSKRKKEGKLGGSGDDR